MPKTESARPRAVRAIRNNNPGNIRVGDPWQGLMPRSEMDPDQATETAFCVFLAPKWGFRALARVLISYSDRHKANTIDSIIRRWAPITENDTIAYIDHVCQRTGFGSEEPLDVHAYRHVAPLAKAIAIHESGGWFFSDGDLDEGLRMAGVEPPSKSLSESRTMKAVAAGGTASVSLAAFSEAVREIDPALTAATRIADRWPLVACAILLLCLGAVAYFRFDDWRRGTR